MNEARGWISYLRRVDERRWDEDEAEWTWRKVSRLTPRERIIFDDSKRRVLKELETESEGVNEHYIRKAAKASTELTFRARLFRTMYLWLRMMTLIATVR